MISKKVELIAEDEHDLLVVLNRPLLHFALLNSMLLHASGAGSSAMLHSLLT